MDRRAFAKAAECLKALAHPERLRALALLRHERLTVGELALRLGLRPHVMSEHLRLLLRCGFLVATREGRQVFYALGEQHVTELLACMERRFGGEDYGTNNR